MVEINENIRTVCANAWQLRYSLSSTVQFRKSDAKCAKTGRTYECVPRLVVFRDATRAVQYMFIYEYVCVHRIRTSVVTRTPGGGRFTLNLGDLLRTSYWRVFYPAQDTIRDDTSCAARLVAVKDDKGCGCKWRVKEYPACLMGLMRRRVNVHYWVVGVCACVLHGKHYLARGVDKMFASATAGVQ